MKYPITLRWWIFTLSTLFIQPVFAQSNVDRLKPFDPLNMESRINVDFDSYYFVAQNKFFSFRPGFYYSIPNQRHLLGISIPVVHSIFNNDFAGFENTTGIGDFKFYYTGVPYQSKDALGLQKISLFMEVTAPTGNEQLGRGVGDWVYKPGIMFTYRPDMALHFYPQVNFQFSTANLNSLGGGDGVPDLVDPDTEGKLKVIMFSIPSTLSVDALDGWLTLSPEYIYSFNESTYFLFLRMDIGKMIGDQAAASLQITKFIAGQPRLETLFRVRVSFFLYNQNR
jgi:hypothetical protein